MLVADGVDDLIQALRLRRRRRSHRNSGGGRKVALESVYLAGGDVHVAAFVAFQVKARDRARKSRDAHAE